MDYWKYSGYGGAVYCEYGSSIRFVNCTFENDYALGGVSGVGGDAVRPRDFRMPEQPVDIESFADCPRYTAHLARALRVGPSPDFVRNRLLAIGQ